jgi:hypothetical protein
VYFYILHAEMPLYKWHFSVTSVTSVPQEVGSGKFEQKVGVEKVRVVLYKCGVAVTSGLIVG